MKAKCLKCGDTKDVYRGFCGECLKEEGVKRVLARESTMWKSGALKAIRMTAATHKKFTADHVKDTADAMKLPKPHHPNCWGGVFRIALSKGYMHQTGRFLPSTRAKHHSQCIAEYSTKRVKTEAERWKARAYKARDRLWEAQKTITELEEKLDELRVMD
jgi:hypothetical protein